jgi:hypothetical protein
MCLRRKTQRGSRQMTGILMCNTMARAWTSSMAMSLIILFTTWVLECSAWLQGPHTHTHTHVWNSRACDTLACDCWYESFLFYVYSVLSYFIMTVLINQSCKACSPVCVYLYFYICFSLVCMRRCIVTFMLLCMCTCLCVLLHACGYMCMCSFVYVHVSLHMYPGLDVSSCVCICVCVYTHIHT